ncbi:MAG: hypothetical protein ABEH80_01200 [Halobaculum sp.]
MTDESTGTGENPDDRQPLGEAWETDWPEEMESRERVESVAETLRQPRSAQWVAQRANVAPKTARKYLSQFVERGALTTEQSSGSRATLYKPDPERKMLDHVLELAERSTAELTTLRTEIADEIEAWQTEFDVDSPTELRLTIDESLTAAERRRRERVAHRWESREHLRSSIDVAVTFQRHRDRFGLSPDADRLDSRAADANQ